MIKRCTDREFSNILAVINDAAVLYKGIIPEECWHEPYMTDEYLRKELDSGVVFFGFEEKGELIGVMALQEFPDVTLIRHAYVRKSHQKKGIGGKLLNYIMEQTAKPLLVGTWKNTFWSIRFYVKRGFKLLGEEDMKKHGDLLKKYWTITDTHREASVVLADKKWVKQNE